MKINYKTGLHCKQLEIEIVVIGLGIETSLNYYVNESRDSGNICKK
jgi:hypothetical protein